jgi:4-amino-4-deoxy-L-arabinose transferase-like glycosyltransferase
MSIATSPLAEDPSFKTEWWTPRLAGPVIAAAVVRLALLAATLVRSGSGALLQTDTDSYLEPGRNLLLHGRFFADGVPDLLRTPGYSLFLAITSLAGLPAAALANVILSVFSVILVWKLGRTVFGDNRIALGAAWIFAFEPISVTWSCILMSETLFLALLLLSLERLAVFLRGRRLPVLAVSGLWLARGNLCPSGYLLPAGCLGSGIVYSVGASSKPALEGARRAADQCAPLAGRLADTQLG